MENSPLLCGCQAGWVLWFSNSDTLARTQTCTAVYTHIHTKQKNVAPERVGVRSAGSACGQRCIVACLYLPGTFNSADIQLLVVTQDQQAAWQPEGPTTPAFTLPHCCVQDD